MWKSDSSTCRMGTRAGGSWHPIVKMEWIDAVRLDRYVEQHFGEPDVIVGIADKFAHAVGTLDEAGAAHGDLQHGNVLVTQSGELRLVDYDGMFVPALAGRKSHELGHPNYQHPKPNRGRLRAVSRQLLREVGDLHLAARPCHRPHDLGGGVGGGDDALVFKRPDFDAGIFSQGFGAIEAIGHDRLGDLSEQLRTAVGQDLGKVRHLPVPISIEIAKGFAVANAFVGSTPVEMESMPSTLPSWMAGVQPAGASRNPRPFGRGSRLDDRPARRTTTRHGEVQHSSASGCPNLRLRGSWHGRSPWGNRHDLSIMEAIAPAIAVLALAAMTSWGAYRLAPEVRAKYGARRELSAQRKEANKAFRTVDNLDKERASNDEDERRKAEGIQRHQSEAVLQSGGRTSSKAEQRMQSALRKHAEKRAGLASQEQKGTCHGSCTDSAGLHAQRPDEGYSITSSAKINGIGSSTHCNPRRGWYSDSCRLSRSVDVWQRLLRQ